ncbi:MAG: hypothetical protein KC535_05300, partial [Nanoarchaeota archaeon]|nr:hypothetical protein [Nanoarchaeota archaeon]
MDTKRMIIALSLSVIVLGILGYIWSVNVSFALNPEIEIETSTPQLLLQATNGENVSFDLRTTVDTPLTCTPSCTFTLVDAQTGEVIFFENMTVKSSFHATVPFQVVDSFSGQKPVQYTVRCENIPSPFCSTSKEPYFQTTLMMINHSQSPEQIKTQEQVRLVLENISSQFSEAALVENESLSFLSQLPFNSSQEIFLRQSIANVSLQIVQSRQSFDRLLDRWSLGEYESMSLAELYSFAKTINVSSKELLDLDHASLNLLQDSLAAVRSLNGLIVHDQRLIILGQWLNEEEVSVQDIDDARIQIAQLKDQVSKDNISSLLLFTYQLSQLNETLKPLLELFDARQMAVID